MAFCDDDDEVNGGGDDSCSLSDYDDETELSNDDGAKDESQHLTAS